jgi:hypothetical protein
MITYPLGTSARQNKKAIIAFLIKFTLENEWLKAG